ncbi:MAG: hypothetical protein J6S14_00305 [Clostridia bacterium]|nr:hypothetical protein [Clostridia bacterium]
MERTAKQEYKSFIQNYLLKLLGISKDNNIQNNEDGYKGQLISQENDYIFFSTNTETPFKIKYTRVLSEDNLNVGKNIIQAFFKVAEFKMDTKGIANTYYSETQKITNYELAIQKGLCNWIVGKNNNSIEHLIKILEKWSVQTYEGKKVTLGFIINPSATSTFGNDHGSFKDFLTDDFAAVFTDCIQSVIELDDNCDFCRYLSITENDIVESYQLSNYLPIRFSSVIQKYVTENCVGIFLLNNGDIILSKKGEIRFVKRNLSWLNMSYDAFKNAFGEYLINYNISDSLIESIYASTLDVSFSHTGGIISIVNDVSYLTKSEKDGFPILHKCDFLLDQISYDSLKSYFKDQNENYNITNNKHLTLSEGEINKRILKRKALDKLVNKKTFCKIDRKLRNELISLDGACILTTKGDICSFGAIIKNDSGSSGGGRGAASKKLSRFGMAIKISTDGYIELYINGDLKYAIK